MNTSTTHILDARGMNCPLPILKTKKMLGGMSAGEQLSIRATDPGSVKDFEAFCSQTGNILVASEGAEGEFSFIIEKV